ncbi:MCE family protein [Mycobacterium sp. 48b]|uniref:MCE family protein n=1 Tax=Mycobacterium sp. 48b TaxID=3400426 RepID=UPI003AAEBCA6
MLTRLVRIQLVIFTICAVVAAALMAFEYIKVQTFLGIGRNTVTLELPAAGGLYHFSNVTYRGVQVGEVTKIDLAKDRTRHWVQATISLNDDVEIPADVMANVRSVSAVGEQYVDLVPRTGGAPFLRNGSVIPQSHTTLPQPVGPALDRVSALLGTFPKERLQGLLDELHKGLGGAEYDLQSLFDSTSTLAGRLNEVGDQSRDLLRDSGPLLDTQTDSLDAIRTWTRSLAAVTGQLVTNDPQIRTLLTKGPNSFNEVTKLFNDLKPTLPILLANLSTMGQLGVTYHPSLEQILVLLPPVISIVQSAQPNRNAQGLGIGSFRITISDPPACTVGFLPPSSWRPPYDTTTIDTPDDLYCKLPQDSPIGVRGSRNFPCMNKPGKRAPTVALCDSDEEFEPVAQKQPVLGPYPRDPNLEAQGVPPDSRWFPDQGLYSPPGEGPQAPQTPPPPVPTTMPVPPPGTGADAPPAGPNPPVPEPDGSSGTPPLGVDPAPGAAPASAALPPATSAVQFARYNPRTGDYVGGDGKLYRQTDLAEGGGPRSWQDMVLAPAK